MSTRALARENIHPPSNPGHHTWRDPRSPRSRTRRQPAVVQCLLRALEARLEGDVAEAGRLHATRPGRQGTASSIASRNCKRTWARGRTGRFSSKRTSAAISWRPWKRTPLSCPASTWFRLRSATTPHHELGAQVLGFMAEVDPDALVRLRALGYMEGDRRGTAGIERGWESYLRGTRGWEKNVVDSRGRQPDRPRGHQADRRSQEARPGARA